MEIKDKIKNLLDISYSPFHVVKNVEDELLNKGFKELKENENFNIELGKNYYVKRNGTSIIAFKIPSSLKDINFRIEASHTDSPTFKLKPHPAIKNKNYVSINVEPYGGMIMSTFLDRPLSIAGRVMIEKNGNLENKLFNIDRDLLQIPNVAIHMNREVNTGYHFNPAVDLIPLISTNPDFDFEKMLLKELHEEDSKVSSFDLFLYNRDKAHELGYENEFISSPKIDNLTSVYLSLESLLNNDPSTSIDLLAAFDNEEVGSLTRQGANSTFLVDILKRIVLALGGNKDDFYKAVASSMMLSVDNAHAIHPNHMEYADKTSEVLLNKGLVIKYNAAQHYTTDSFSSSIVKHLCDLSNAKYQEFTNRSDMRGGGTLGNLSNSEVSLVCADIGLPQLAMHSCNELIGTNDLQDMYLLLSSFYKVSFVITEQVVKFN